MELRITGLSKQYASGVQALAQVDLTISAGMFGLLGPNGAGKSTLMRTLATLQDADHGSATLGDLDVLRDKDRVRQILGYLPQEFGLYPKVTAREMLEHFALLKGIAPESRRRDDAARLLQHVNLWEVRNRPLGTFSGGMRQRFGIAQALLGDPQLIIVDEPTAGLDPEERVRFHNLLADLGEHRIVILSTHIVDDVADLCQRMAIIHRGRVVLQGEPPALISALAGRVYAKPVGKDTLAAHQSAHRVISTRRSAGQLVIHVVADSPPGPDFAATAADLGDVYFHAITGQGKPATAPSA